MKPRARRRPHCTCTNPQNLSLEEAAGQLKCGERWLLDKLRAKAFPHQRCGGIRVMCPCDLLVAMDLCAVEPRQAVAPVTEIGAEVSHEAKVPALKPLQGRLSNTG